MAPRISVRALLGPLAWPALAIAVVALGALAFSVAPWASLAGQYLRYESAPVRLGYLLLFGTTAFLLAATGAAARRRTVSWFLAACSVVALEAAWEWIANRYGLAGALDRPDGNLGNAALLGVVEAMALPLAIGRLLAPAGLRWLPVALLVLLGLLLSNERSAWLGGLVAGLLVVANRLPRARRQWAAGAGLVLLVGAVALLLGPLRALNADPYTLRLEVWQRVLPMIQARPLLGWGEDTFGLVFGQFAHGYLPGVVFDRAHSEPLDLAAAQGLLGVAAAAWFSVAFVVGVARTWRREESPALLAALAAYSVWALVNFDWVPATAVFWLLAAVAWSAAAGAGAAEPRRLALAIPALATAAIVALLFGILPLAADLAAYRSNPQLAVTLDPIQSHYHQRLGETYLRKGQVAAAATELRRATRLGDDDALAWWELADAEARLGDPAAAAAARARARQIDPSIGSP